MAKKKTTAKKTTGKKPMMKNGGIKKSLPKAQFGRTKRTKNTTNVTTWQGITPSSNASARSTEYNDEVGGERFTRTVSPVKSRKNLFGNQVQKTTYTQTEAPVGGGGSAYTGKTKDVFNKKGQLLKSVTKEKDLDTGKKTVNVANYKSWLNKKGGSVKTKRK
jgi:hypothetical protein